MTERVRVLLTIACIFTNFAGITAADVAEPTAEQLDMFEKKVRPLLSENCYQCHSTQAGKSKGGLLLDARAEILKGGTTGPALVPGDPKKSLLIQAVRGDDPDLTMPPKGKRLNPEQIADLETWIKAGAPAPKAQTLTRIQAMLEQAKTHWAFQPVKVPEIPVASSEKNPIDSFILSALRAKDLKLAPPADKRTLIRRAYFDLLGLPPTNEEVSEFVADNSADAYAKLIDKLLASPRYGERWGRHWLDVARYADTMGAIYGGDDNYKHSYTYRDYVIHAFNDDKPYDRFVMEQIAGDSLVQSDDNSALAAMGFLTCGRRKDRTVDDEVYDDRIDVISRGLMGMTVACARCHDHKLEPIPSRDYYSLYSILHSSKEADVYPEIKSRTETPEHKAFVVEHDKLRKAFAEVVAREAEKVADESYKRVGDYLLAVYRGKNQKPTPQNKIVDEILKPKKMNDALYSFYVERQAKWFAATPAVFGLWSELSKLSDADISQLPAIIKKHAENTSTHPLLAKYLKENPPKDMNESAALYSRVFAETYDAARKAGKPLDPATLQEADDVNRSVKDLEGQINKRVVTALMGNAIPDASLEALRKILNDKDAPTNNKPEIFRNTHLFSDEVLKDIDKTSKPYEELETKHPGAPARAMALQDGDIYNGKVFLRGNPNTQGEAAPRKFLEALSPNGALYPKDNSGRLELAKSIASKDNPLTSRVIVNRIWQWHFGEGLVRTPSDFGFRGERPTHPELLDYLASTFVADGWSIKKLHRRIMLSAAYRQSSVCSPEALKADPENRLLSHMNARKLEFEAFRDSQLLISGRLSLKEGGRGVDLTKGDKDSLRRTVYGLVDRKLLPNLYRSFDFPDPNFSAARRSQSALTPEALFLMNSGVVIDSARALAEKCHSDKDKDDAECVRKLFRLALQREASEKEVQRAVQFIATYPKNDIVRPEATDWQYGRGTYDSARQTVTNFVPLAFYTGTAWQMAQKAADGLTLTAVGGDTAKGMGVGAVRRWTSPMDGKIKINGELEHSQGDEQGVMARVFLKGSKMLGEWKAIHNSVTTALDVFEIKKGDVLDFVVSGDDAATDRFQWAPTITMVTAEMPGMPGMPRIWDAKTDFMDVRKMPKPIGPWEELAQILLVCNEFVYVD